MVDEFVRKPSKHVGRVFYQVQGFGMKGTFKYQDIKLFCSFPCEFLFLEGHQELRESNQR